MRHVVFGGAVFAVGVAAIFFAVQPETDDDFVRAGILRCIEDRSLWRGDCFDALAGSLRERMGIDAALLTLARIDQEQPFKAVCHGLVHEIGQDLYTENRDVPASFAQCARAIACGEGCYHGVIEGYLAEEGNAEPASLATLCSRDFARNEMDYRACNHGIGHAMMLVTDGAITESLVACDAVPQDVRFDCYTGVFMENVFGSELLGHPESYVSRADPRYPCTIVDARYLDACFASQGSFVILAERNYHAGAIFCADAPSEHQAACYGALGGEIVVETSDPAAFAAACLLAPPGASRRSCMRFALYFGLQGNVGDPAPLGAMCLALPAEERGDCSEELGHTLALWYPENPGARCSEAFGEEVLRDTCVEAARL